MRQSAQSGFLIRALLILLACLCAAGTSAQGEGAPLRIGYVDMKRLLDNAPQVVAGRKTLEAEFAARDRALVADEARLEELRSRLQREEAIMTRDAADALKRETNALERAIRRKRDELRSQLKTRTDQELDRSWQEINNAVVEFARDQGYDLIVPSPVVYASSRADVTDAVLERLRRAQPPGG